MMINNNGGNGKTFYFDSVEGSFATRVDEGTEGAVTRKLTAGPNEGQEVSEIHVSALTGQLTNVLIKEMDFGDQLYITLEDKELGERYIFRTGVDSRVAQQFVKRIPNIKLNADETLIGVFNDADDKTVFWMKQDGEKVPFAFTKDKPNGLPEATKKTVKGKDKWDFEAQEEFLYNLLVEFTNNFKSEEQSVTKEESVDDDLIPF